MYIHGSREESNIYVYELEGHEDEGLIIRVYYPYEEKKTGKKGYDEDWYVYESTTKKLDSIETVKIKNNELTLSFEEINFYS